MDELKEVVKVIREQFGEAGFMFSQLIETVFFYDKREITIYDLNEIMDLKKTKSKETMQKLILEITKLAPEKSVISDRDNHEYDKYELELIKHLVYLVQDVELLIDSEKSGSKNYPPIMEQLDIHKKIFVNIKTNLQMIYTQPDRVGIDNYYGNVNKMFANIIKMYFGSLLRIYNSNAEERDGFWIDAIEYSNKTSRGYKLSYLKTNKMLISNKVQLIEIKSVTSLIGELSKFEDENVFFRGHSRLNYKLIPSIFRGFQSHEYSMIQDLRIALPNEFNRDMNHFDMLLKMQHYDLPTRLLDLTTNPLVALYFAASENNDYHGEVKVISTVNDQVCYPNSDRVRTLSAFAFIKPNQKIDIISQIRNNIKHLKILDQKYQQPLIHEIRTFVTSFEPRILVTDMIKPLIVKSPNANPRISAQSGSFIIAPMDQFQHMELDVNTPTLKGKQIVFLVDKNKKKEILNQLSKLNINKGTMFPEIAEKSKYIRESYLN